MCLISGEETGLRCKSRVNGVVYSVKAVEKRTQGLRNVRSGQHQSLREGGVGGARGPRRIRQ